MTAKPKQKPRPKPKPTKTTELVKDVETTASEYDQYDDVMAKTRLFNELIARSNDGDQAALARIRGILWHPDGKGFVDLLGDVAKHARRAVIRRLVPNQEAAELAIHQKVADMRGELEGPNASALERLLVDRIIMSWLQVADADRRAALTREVTVTQGDYLQRRQDRAQRRLLAAIKTLATVRRLALPIHVDVDLQVSGAVETRTENEPALSASPVLRIPATRWQTTGANN